LARLYDKRGKPAEAEPLARRSLEIREKALGPDHPIVASSLDTLAEVLCHLGRHDQAEPLARRSPAIREKDPRRDPPERADSLGPRGKDHEAEAVYKRALAIREKALPADHPALIDLLDRFAALLRKAGRAAEADAIDARAKAARGRHEEQSPTDPVKARPPAP